MLGLRFVFRKLALVFGLFALAMLVLHGSTITTIAQPQLIEAGLVQPPPAEPEAMADNSLSYPRLGIAAPLTEAAWTSPMKTQDWSTIRLALAAGTSLAYEADRFKDARLAFLTGHSSDTYPHRFSSVFAGLGQARIDDTFVLKVQGSFGRYRVVDRQLINPTDLARFEQLAPADGGQRIALVTCWPPLTTKQRLVIVGERTEM